MQAARAREIELRTAQRAHILCETDEALALADDVFGILRSELSGLPAMVTRDLEIRSEIEKGVNEILNRTAKRLATRAQDLRANWRGCFTSHLSRRLTKWVKSGNAHNEPMMSAFHPKATEQWTQFYVGSTTLLRCTQRVPAAVVRKSLPNFVQYWATLSLTPPFRQSLKAPNL